MGGAQQVEKRVRREALRLSMTDNDLRDRRLSVDFMPEHNGKRIVFTPRKDTDAGKAYRFMLKDAPTGLGVWVGRTRTTYELSLRGPAGFRRVALGSVHDMTLAEAKAGALAQAEIIRTTGEHPRVVEQRRRELSAVKDITVGECMDRYIEELERKVKLGKVKPVSVQAVRDSLQRLERPEIGLAGRIVRTIDKKTAEKAFDATRLSCMKLSNRIPTAIREALADVDDWAALSSEELARRGVVGKYVSRVRSAGKAAAEHTLGDAIRSVNFVLEEELEAAQLEGRQPNLFINPLKAIYKLGLFRAPAELAKHYEAAAVRNPLGEGDDSLARVLKAIVGRRDEQGGNNRAASDYLLLTLLFGSRRSETAKLQWWDMASPAERAQDELSWVWLAGPDETHPKTGRKGSQAFFHDTKNGTSRFVPICHFAEQVLLRRLDERAETLAQAPARIESARRAYERLRKETKDVRKRTEAKRKIFIETSRVSRAKWVFPARSSAAKAGHYVDSKAIIANVRRDAGLTDGDLDIGLTPHDLRRTFGRYAEKLFGGGRIVSQLLHHTPRQTEQAQATSLYTEQEWHRLREAFGKVEESMIATSPRVWNRLKGVDKQRLDDSNDSPIPVFKRRRNGVDHGSDADT